MVPTEAIGAEGGLDGHERGHVLAYSSRKKNQTSPQCDRWIWTFGLPAAHKLAQRGLALVNPARPFWSCLTRLWLSDVDDSSPARSMSPTGPFAASRKYTIDQANRHGFILTHCGRATEFLLERQSVS